MKKKIAFQGHLGAYSHLATNNLYPEGEAVPMQSFEACFKAVEEGRADLAVIPVENSTAGRVTDVHALMNHTKLHIIGEYFLPVKHCLLALPEAKIENITHVHSHIQALSQCEKNLKANKMKLEAYADTAGAAQMVSESNDTTQGALASSFAAELYGLQILKENFQDTSHNTTRFLVISNKTQEVKDGETCITTILFKVKNIPSALYKALGGFSSNGLNLLKIESYLEGGSFNAAAFYIDVEGHIDSTKMKNALEELKFFSSDIRILGCYSAGKHRNIYTKQ